MCHSWYRRAGGWLPRPARFSFVKLPPRHGPERSSRHGDTECACQPAYRCRVESSPVQSDWEHGGAGDGKGRPGASPVPSGTERRPEGLRHAASPSHWGGSERLVRLKGSAAAPPERGDTGSPHQLSENRSESGGFLCKLAAANWGRTSLRKRRLCPEQLPVRGDQTLVGRFIQ